MKRVQRGLWLFSVVAFAVVLFAGGYALAEPITYTENVTGTGSLGGTAFTNANLSFSMSTSTTSDIGGSWFTNSGPLTVTVAGIGTATFTDPDIQASMAFWVHGISWTGPTVTNFYFSDIGGNAFILGTLVPGLVDYNGSTSFGPVVGDPTFNSGSTFATTDGYLVLNGTSGESSFAANAAAVPETSGLVPLGIGLVGAVGVIRRKLTH